jgi:hypothetical protein
MKPSSPPIPLVRADIVLVTQCKADSVQSLHETHISEVIDLERSSETLRVGHRTSLYAHGELVWFVLHRSSEDRFDFIGVEHNRRDAVWVRILTEDARTTGGKYRPKAIVLECPNSERGRVRGTESFMMCDGLGNCVGKLQRRHTVCEAQVPLYKDTQQRMQQNRTVGHFSHPGGFEQRVIRLLAAALAMARGGNFRAQPGARGNRALVFRTQTRLLLHPRR